MMSHHAIPLQSTETQPGLESACIALIALLGLSHVGGGVGVRCCPAVRAVSSNLQILAALA